MEGSGEPVVLVHSSASSSRQWRGLVEAVAGQYRVIAPNLCGYGNESPEAESLGHEDDRHRIRQHVADAGGPVHLIGHSYGGLLSIRTALEQPDAIRSLTLIEPVCFHLLEQSGDKQAFAEIRDVRDRQVALSRAGDDTAAAKGFVSYWMGPDAWDAMPAERQKAVADTMPKVANEWPGAFGHTTRLEDYDDFKWPVLLVHAADTTRAAHAVMDLIASRLPHATRAEIAAGGHMSPVTNPKPVIGHIVSFLSGL